MLNRASVNHQAAGGVQGRGHYHVAQLSAPLGSQPQATGLRDAVYHLVVASRACDGPEIEFCDDLVESELRPTLQLAVLFIVRELMLNAMHHSWSKKALVGVAQHDGCIFVQVQDWGVGFDPKNVLLNLHGLEGIRDLVRWLAGSIEIDSQPGAGTCVIVELPLSQESAANQPTTSLNPR